MNTSKTTGQGEVAVATTTKTAISSTVALGLVGAASVFAFSFFWSNWSLFQRETKPSQTVVKQTAPQSLRDLTTELLKAEKNPGSNAAALNQIAKKRQTALTKLLTKNPQEILVAALPNDLRDALIEAGVEAALLEERVERVEGVFEEEHNNTLDDEGNLVNHNERHFLILPDNQEITFHIPEFEGPRGIPVMHGSTLALTDAVKINDQVIASADNFTVVNEVLPGHTVKKVVGIAYRFQSDPDCYISFCPATKTLDYRLREPIFTTTLSTRKYFLENSFGQLVLNGKTSEQGDVFGTFTIPDSTSCSYSAIRTASITAAAAQGVDLTGYDYYVLLGHDGGACRINGYSGNTYASQGSRTPGGNLAHEMGHMFGIIHVNSYPCMDENTARVPLSNNCMYHEYGKGWDVVGGVNDPNQLGHMVEYHKARLNWLPAANIRTITTDGTYTIAPIEQLVNGPMALRVRRNSSQHFSIQYHQPHGDFEGHFPASTPQFNGLMVHINGGFRDVGMLDMEPEANLTGTYTDIQTGQLKYLAFLNTGFTDYTLKAGKTFTDPVSGISIKTVSITPTEAAVQVTFGSGTCLRANPTIAVSPATHWGYAGAPRNYNVTLTNNDTSACANSTFTVNPTLPSGWAADPSSLTESLAGGASVTRTLTVTPPGTAVEGFYDIPVTAADNSTPSRTASTTMTYVVQPPDTTGPTVTITSPANGAKLKGRNLKISATASDSSGVARIELLVNGVSRQVCLNTTSCNVTVQLSSLNTGTNTITATATDASANANQSSTSVSVTK